MLYRKAYDKLLHWKSEPKKVALYITGARQVGKTSIVRQLGAECYESFIELNFLTDPDSAKIFSGSLDANTIITNLTAYTQKAVIPGKTLVLLDELQACPRAHTAIEFLVKDGRCDYIATGPFISEKPEDIRTYPLAYQHLYRMYPMDLEEFLWANGIQQSTITYLENCFQNQEPVADEIHQSMCRLFYTYMVVGGMPAVVQTYIETHDITQVVDKQREILRLYHGDITRCTRKTDAAKIRAILNLIPEQLNKKNPRFFLTSVSPKARQERYADSFNWLRAAGVAIPCYNVIEPQAPLYQRSNLFKLFMGDVGLLCAACTENVQFPILNGDLQVNMGSILENAIAQQLASNRVSLYYFDRKDTGTIDFVIQNRTTVELLNAEPGNNYTHHPAVDKIQSIKSWQIFKTNVLCKGNVKSLNGIHYYPWYMVLFMYK